MASTLITFQEFQQAAESGKVEKFIEEAITRHKQSKLYRDAVTADAYYNQINEGITNFMRTVYSSDGTRKRDFTAPNNKICSNFFKRLNIQRAAYSLGKGIGFASATDKGDKTKEILGDRFDDDVMNFGKLSLVHGVSFPFWNLDHIDTFKVTEFAPFWDEDSGALKAGVRFWQIDKERNVYAVLYEEDGYTVFKSGSTQATDFKAKVDKTGYKVTYTEVPADGMITAVEESNYTRLPIIPVWGSDSKQSTIVGMKAAIDSYDLVKSGFANDLEECAEIYWLVENYGGMTDDDLAQFRDRMKLMHIATADTQDGGKITPHTQEIPHEAREKLLERIQSDLYRDFGALDVHAVAAGATNDHIDAAYQPMDEEAAEFERHIRECIMDILALQGIEDTPVFSRNRVSNTKEQVEIILLEAPYLDEETILRKLPNITPDEVAEILKRKDEDDMDRMNFQQEEPESQSEAVEEEE